MKQGWRARVAKRGVTTLAAVTVTVVSAVFAAPASADRHDDKAAKAGLPTIADQMTYRAELSLPATREVVTDLNARWASGDLPHATTEGAVFTAAEQAELDTREDAAHEIAEVARHAFADVLGGIYIDHASGKTVVLLTGDLKANLSALRSRVAHPDRLVGKPARFSLADLTAAGDTIMARHAEFGVTATGVDERNNTVDVLLAKDTPAARAGVLSLLRPSQARMVRFQESSGAETLGVGGQNAPPAKGGQGIIGYSTSGTAAACTSAFIGYVRARTDIGIYLNTYYMLTAGHCIPLNEVENFFTQADLYIVGDSDRKAYTYGGSADGLRIPLYNQNDKSQLVAITATSDRFIYDRQPTNADVVTERVCMSGAVTGGERCGTLLYKALQATNDQGILLKNLRIASFDGIKGDSGGSVLYGSQAKGIVSCRVYYNGANRMCYTHIGYNMSGLGMTELVGVA